VFLLDVPSFYFFSSSYSTVDGIDGIIAAAGVLLLVSLLLLCDLLYAWLGFPSVASLFWKQASLLFLACLLLRDPSCI
jgi:hypothetical protein